MASSEELFGLNYLLLKPQEASAVDLGRLLFSSNLNNRGFIECPREIEAREFRQRWLLFISIVAQKVLVASRNSLKNVGDTLELWLNLLSSNGGLIRLLFKFLIGNYPFDHFFSHHYDHSYKLTGWEGGF